MEWCGKGCCDMSPMNTVNSNQYQCQSMSINSMYTSHTQINDIYVYNRYTICMSSFNSSPHDGHSPQSFAQERWTDDQIQHGKTRAAGKSLVTIHCISDIRRYLCRAEADIPEASHALLDNLRVQFIFVDGCTWPAFFVTQVSKVCCQWTAISATTQQLQ